MTGARGRRRRVAYVLHTPPDGRPPREVVAAWPNATRLLRALHDTDLVDPVAVWRAGGGRGDDATVTVDGVEHRFVGDGRLGRRVATAVRALHPDVVHLNSFLFAVPTLVLRAAVGRRVRLVVQHHGERPAGSGRAAVAQRVAGRAVDAAAFTGADEWAAHWRAAGVLRERHTVHEVLEGAADVEPVAVDAARARTGVHGAPAVAWVGRLIDGKDPLGAVDAFARLAASVPDAHLWMLCTNRTLDVAVKDRIGERGLGERVTLVGPVPHADMGAWLSAADVFLSTSRSEGSGYALIEALTCGCTPVVSDLGPHRAIAGTLGARFPVGDAAAAGRALAKVRVLARDAVRAEAARRLNWDRIARQLLTAYGIDGDRP